MKWKAAALARRLLRGLDDPAELCANDLVAALFADNTGENLCGIVRCAVMRAVEALKPVQTSGHVSEARCRRYEIVVRYDLRRQPLRSVLSDLGIEKSQFYRERVQALECIANSVRAWALSLRQPQAVTFDLAEQYRISNALQRAGNADIALGVLVRAVHAHDDPLEKGRCLLNIAEVHLDAGRIPLAQEFVQAALARAGSSAEATISLAYDAAFVSAQIAWSLGATADALRILESLIPSARALCATKLAGASAVLGRALALKATIAYHVSTLDECSGLVADGCAVLSPQDEQTADVFAELLTIRTSIHTAKLGELDTATADDDALMQFAKQHGLVRKLAVGLKDLAVINHYRGNRKAAEIYADQALTLASAVSGPKERAVATFEWAHMRAETAASGELRRVREAIVDIRTRLPRGGFWWGYSYAIDSYAFLAERDGESALREADNALNSFRFVKSDRGIGISRALQARALRILGAFKESNLRAEQAIEHLERAPQSFWLPYAQELLAAAR